MVFYITYFILSNEVYVKIHSMNKISLGSSAPEFVLPDQDGALHSLSDYAGQWVLLYFYPKDDTPGCTKEAICMMDNLPDFAKLKVAVLGVSIDSQKSHAKFAKKYNLGFTLLSDENKDLVEAYGVWSKKKFMGREYMGTLRQSFLIDPEGKIAKIYEEVKPAEHATEVLEDLKQLKKK